MSQIILGLAAGLPLTLFDFECRGKRRASDRLSVANNGVTRLVVGSHCLYHIQTVVRLVRPFRCDC